MNKEKRDLLVFGYGLTLICWFVAGRLWFKHGPSWTVWAWAAAGAVVISLTFFNLPALKKFYTVWMKVAGVIGHVVTTVVLSVLFYVLFGTVGIALRLLGKDILDERMDRSRKSYWVPRPARPFDARLYKQQF